LGIAARDTLQAEPQSGEAAWRARSASVQQGDQGQSPWWGVRGAKPPEADDIFYIKLIFLHWKLNNFGRS